MKLSEKQNIVAKDNTRFRVLVTGRRFGKTTLAIRELAFAARIPNQVVWYVAPSYRQAKQICWVQIKQILQDLKWVRKINEAELTIHLKNNSRICLRGADHADSLRGVGINFLVIDESADVSENAWKAILRPTLADTKGRALFAGTPKGLNWFYELYRNGQDKNNVEWNSYQYTTLDGGWVDDIEIEQAKKDLDKRTFQQEFLATFENFQGVVYSSFDINSNVGDFDLPEDENIIHIGIDFNLDPMSAVCTYIKDGTINVFDEIKIWSSNTDELVEEIHSRYKNKKIFVYPDPSCRQRRTSAGGRTDLSILQNAGFIVKTFNKHMAVRDRINSVNSKLCSAAGIRSLIISSKAKTTLNSLSKQVYKEDTSIPDKSQGYDHMNDALGYLVSYLYPITTNYKPLDPQRFMLRTGGIDG